MIAPTIARVRPGKTAHAWVGRSVLELKGDDPLVPVTLIAPNYYAGRQTRWALARADGYVNVRSMLLTDVAVQLAGLEVDAPEPLTPVLEESPVRTVIDEIGGVFASVAHHRSLHQALLQLFRDMRRLEVHINAPQTEMARAALRAYAVFERLIERYADRTSIRKRATHRLQLATFAPRGLTELGSVILYLPTRVDAVDARLLAAMARWVPLRAAFAWLGEDDDLANQLPEQGAMDLEAALLAHSRPSSRSPMPLVEVEPPAVAIIRAPDPAEEIREVVRSVARDLGAQVPLHQIAVLYRQTDPYGPLVRDSLTLAGFPWSALEGRTLADSRPGSALLCLVEVRQRGFAREAVLGWIDVAPRGQVGLPGSAWDRLSRSPARRRSPWRTLPSASRRPSASPSDTCPFHRRTIWRPTWPTACPPTLPKRWSSCARSGAPVKNRRSPRWLKS